MSRSNVKGAEMRFGIGVVSRAMTLLIEITFHLLCQSVKGLVVSEKKLRRILDYVVGEKRGAH